MDLLKKIWPTPFRIKPKDIGALIVHLIVLLVAAAIAGVLIWVLSKIPVLGLVAGILGTLVDIYCLVAILLSILTCANVIK